MEQQAAGTGSSANPTAPQETSESSSAANLDDNSTASADLRPTPRRLVAEKLLGRDFSVRTHTPPLRRMVAVSLEAATSLCQPAPTTEIVSKPCPRTTPPNGCTLMEAAIAFARSSTP